MQGDGSWGHEARVVAQLLCHHCIPSRHPMSNGLLTQRGLPSKRLVGKSRHGQYFLVPGAELARTRYQSTAVPGFSSESLRCQAGSRLGTAAAPSWPPAGPSPLPSLLPPLPADWLKMPPSSCCSWLTSCLHSWFGNKLFA